MSKEIRTSIQGTSYYDRDLDEYFVKQTKLTNKYSQFTHRYERISKEELPPIKASEFNKLVKKLSLNIVFRREAISTETLRPLSALFTKRVTIEVKGKHTYLSLSHRRDFILYHNLAEGSTQTASINELSKKAIGEVPLTELSFSKERRLTESEAKELLKKPDTLNRVFTEESDGSLSNLVYFNKM